MRQSRLARLGVTGFVTVFLLIGTLSFSATPSHAAGSWQIRDDGTGGDCYLIGTWDGGTKTCVLTTDVSGFVNVDGNGITLDGDGHSVSGPGYVGVAAYSHAGVTIKNVVVRYFTYIGIDLSSSSSTVEGNTISDASTGINVQRLSTGSTISGNIISNARLGIYVNSASGGTISGNTVSSRDCAVYLDSSSSNTVNGNTVSSDNCGIWLFSTSSNTIGGNTVSTVSNAYGIYLVYHSDSNTVSGNTLSNNPITIRNSNGNVVNGNAVTGTTLSSILLDGATGTSLAENAMVNGGIVILEGDMPSSLSFWNSHTIDSSNTVNGKPVQYCKNANGGTIPSGAGQVILAGCSNVIVEDQELSVFRAVQVAFSADNIIRRNTVNCNCQGIYLYNSDRNAISNSSVSGIVQFESSDGNTMADNSISTADLVGGGPAMYLYSSDSNYVVRNVLIGGGVWLGSSSYNTIKENTFHNLHNSFPLLWVASNPYNVGRSEGNIVMLNHLDGDNVVLSLAFADYTMIAGNVLVASSFLDVYIPSSSSVTTIFHNTFSSLGYIYLDTCCSSITWNNELSEGNGWSNYMGFDDGSNGRVADDGIGDTNLPHMGVDLFPLVPIVKITAPAVGSLVAVGSPVAFSGTFADNPHLAPASSHNGEWSLTSPSSTITFAGSVSESAGTVEGSFTFTEAGVYTVLLTVTDNFGRSGRVASVSGVTLYVVVYDPSAGFVTGNGWITSPPGAYTQDPSATGKATFGFVSKYQKGASIPTGSTQFRFIVAGMRFQSTAYDWLVIAGPRAQYKGSGTINGAGGYSFMLTAIDGQQPGGGEQDKLRMKIWVTLTGQIVYDNQMGAPDSADPTTVIGAGSIVIQKG